MSVRFPPLTFIPLLLSMVIGESVPHTGITSYFGRRGYCTGIQNCGTTQKAATNQ